MKLPIAILSAVVLASGAQAADNDAMAKAANGFYTAYSTFHPSDGIPDVAGRARYAPYISERLNALLTQANAAESKFASANKNTPPLVEKNLVDRLYDKLDAALHVSFFSKPPAPVAKPPNVTPGIFRRNRERAEERMWRRD